ncbi:MAG: hypothetical protein LBV46_01230 [Bacteroidales bacterium]|jgi:uncharacterized membrane protein|nr:hypothetical protein [Bacteroidales bacterium]
MKKRTNKILIIFFSIILLLEVIVIVDYSIRWKNHLRKVMENTEQTN